MSVYIFYNKSTGEIIHVHREYYMGSEKTVELDEERLQKEIRSHSPKVDVGIIATGELPKPVRGYRYVVDLNTSKLMLLEKPPLKKKERVK